MSEFKTFKPTTDGLRGRQDVIAETDFYQPEKKLLTILKKHSGRNQQGRVTVRHQGGRHKRYWRQIDFKRQKRNCQGKVISLEYDPNRSANIALVWYPDGTKSYILAPLNLKIGDVVEAGEKVEAKLANALPLQNIPVGTAIHNLELSPGRGGQIVRGGGTSAMITAKEDKMAIVRLPSNELRKFNLKCWASVGQLGNIHVKDIKLGKAGRKRWLGIRPGVRGVAQHPDSHPHGGGEGRTGIGMPSPMSPWGKKTLGKKTRNKRKTSQKYIVQDRRGGSVKIK